MPKGKKFEVKRALRQYQKQRDRLKIRSYNKHHPFYVFFWNTVDCNEETVRQEMIKVGMVPFVLHESHRQKYGIVFAIPAKAMNQIELDIAGLITVETERCDSYSIPLEQGHG